MSRNRKIVYFIIFLLLIISITLCIIKLSRPKNTTLPNQIYSSSQKDIDWNTAVNLIKNCQIKVIFQARTLQINLRGHDNQLYYTVEPKFNDVIKVAESVQGPCDIIQTVTE